VRFERAFEDDANVYLLLELCGAGATLAHCVASRGALPEPEAAAHAAALLACLAYLHAQGVVHRDVKPANCLLRAAHPGTPLAAGASSCIALADLGLAARCEAAGPKRRGVCGTPNYIAPEVLAGASGDGHGFEADAWSVGALTYTMLVGAPPFAAPSVAETYARIRAADLHVPTTLSVRAWCTLRHLWGVGACIIPTCACVLMRVCICAPCVCAGCGAGFHPRCAAHGAIRARARERAGGAPVRDWRAGAAATAAAHAAHARAGDSLRRRRGGAARWQPAARARSVAAGQGRAGVAIDAAGSSERSGIRIGTGFGIAHVTVALVAVAHVAVAHVAGQGAHQRDAHRGAARAPDRAAAAALAGNASCRAARGNAPSRRAAAARRARPPGHALHALHA
jgi:hypothetical protein